MASESLILEVEGKRYTWKLDSGSTKVTVAELKKLIGEKTQKKVLYHEKLRFLVDQGRGPLSDEETVPFAPAFLKVAGPGSVVQMFSLWCQRDGQMAPTPQPQSRQVPRHHIAPTSVPRPSNNGFPMAKDFSTTFRSPLPPSHSNGRGGGGYGGGYNGQVPSFHPNSSNFTTQQVQQVQQVVEEQSRRDLEAALQESKLTSAMDEEAQLRWALEESQKLAEAEAASQRQLEKEQEAMKQAARLGSNSGSCAAAAAAAASEYLEDSDDEGMAWDSDEDDGPPPLVLIPNSEE
eukprot:TRINITY_DN15234_c0_g1_i1.p1 TRINITY_DN15234_c0_g1~~TRINITY_DN15234_c0_g1_i1.p1  ORF type:complete len:291 (+),score=89.79 TRINITY_DN15234_c0_g1_i1:40-912(+)